MCQKLFNNIPFLLKPCSDIVEKNRLIVYYVCNLARNQGELALFMERTGNKEGTVLSCGHRQLGDLRSFED